jgi:UDP-N-acetylglucosamine 2-epimerase (non-hydrolysing)
MTDRAPRRRVMLVFGTRPEAIKLCPVVLALRASALEPVVVVTAQHRELLDQVLSVFGVEPDEDLDLLKPEQTLTEITTGVLAGLVGVIERRRPEAILVQGDTTTAFAGALAGFYAGVPFVHLEAGLRSGNVSAPYPEEMNRRLVTQLATLHLAPTAGARDNLLVESVAPDQVLVTGNTVIDALQFVVRRGAAFSNPALAGLEAQDRSVVLVTAHRRENWGPGMRSLAEALRAIAEAEPAAIIVFPIHPNPVVRNDVLPVVDGLPNVRLIEPLGYREFVSLLAVSRLVLTDSGGLQEEGPSLGKPVLVMRDVTERPEAVAAGTARLVGTDRDRIVKEVLRLLRDDDACSAMANAVNPFGDGTAAERTVAALLHLLGDGPRPADFVVAHVATAGGADRTDS